MRVVSLVPSWTETLVEAGVEVVGRTRYCFYPRGQVEHIPVVGGTKNWNWEAVKAVKPNLLILDKEENPKFMSEQTEIPVLSTQITSIAAMPGALAQMAIRLSNRNLAEVATRWNVVTGWPGLPRWRVGQAIPGLLEWGREPVGPVNSVVYMIWRNPWMTVSKETFISSMLSVCGFAQYLRDFDTKYPKIDLSSYPASETLLLFSSEPYPFLRKKEVLNPVTNPFAFVDGECFSWFGVRSLVFLERLQADSKSAQG
jgi:iron complex transport system substrate-binding protein